MSVEKESVGFFESLFPRDDEKFENHQMWWGVSTGSALIGVQNFSEIVGATVAHMESSRPPPSISGPGKP